MELLCISGHDCSVNICTAHMCTINRAILSEGLAPRELSFCYFDHLFGCSVSSMSLQAAETKFLALGVVFL